MTRCPIPAYITPARVVNVVDGDTIDVEIRKVLRIRLLDCWAPEIHRDHRVPEDQRDAEKAKGFESKANLQALCDNEMVIVRIPTDQGGDFAHIITMGRILGDVWLQKSSQSLSELQVEGGFATKEKPEELK